MSSSPARRHARFSRERIGEVAFEIADREGFEAVSMRRVAHELGAGTMTLYHYVRTKDDLVALMDDLLMGQLLLPEFELTGDWREQTTAILRRTRDVMRRHPWSLLALQRADYGRNALRHREQTLAALATSPFDEDGKLYVMAIADDFAHGHALRTAELLERYAGRSDRSTPPESIVRELDSGDYPRTRASVLDDPLGVESGSTAQLERWLREEFELGAAALLDGLALRLGRHART